jgi:hypothetical protein
VRGQVGELENLLYMAKNLFVSLFVTGANVLLNKFSLQKSIGPISPTSSIKLFSCYPIISADIQNNI